MSKYEYCMVCANSYRERGNLKLYNKYKNMAMHIKLNEVGSWK